MSKHRQMVLAPAGSIDQLVAAVNNGCDAVYLGLESFNARMKAPNFTTENLPQWVDYCHLFGVKVYVALNTSIKNEEFERACDMLVRIYRSNADGIIVTDPALSKIAASLPKPFEIVASTQLSVYNAAGAKFASEYGATTVVCARESTLEGIREIADAGVQVECFIHGATCVCVSGQCLFSSMVGGLSGNRGLCAQPCRKKYTANGTKQGYLLSARDLCGIEVAEELSKAGANVFKIEGRNRRAEYAGITSDVYSRLLENDFCATPGDKQILEEAFNRSMCKLGYLWGDNANIVYPDCQSSMGVHVGVVSGKKIRTQLPIAKGDGFKIFNNNSEIGGAVALESGSGEVAAELCNGAASGMEVRRTTNVQLNEQTLARRRLLPVSMQFTAFAGGRAVLQAVCQDVVVELSSEFIVPSAQNKPTSTEEIKQQLQKTGQSYYTITDIVVEIGQIFLAKSQINGLRRAVLEKLTAELIRRDNAAFSDRQQCKGICLPSVGQCKKEVPRLAVICRTKQELAKAKAVADLLIFKPEVLCRESFETAVEFSAFVDLPPLATNSLRELVEQTGAAIVCHNIGYVQWARELQVPYIAGSGLNIFNDRMADVFGDAETFVYSEELTIGEISRFQNRSGLIFADGELSLMKLMHCPFKLVYGCSCSNCKHSKLVYTDEQGHAFKIVRRKEARCSFELINGSKLSATAFLKRPFGYMVDFDEEVIRHYKNINNGYDDNYREARPYTKGRLVEKVK